MRDTRAMIAGMDPVRSDTAYVFCTTTDKAKSARLTDQSFARMDEAEGITLILPADVARQEGFDADLPMARITLQVHSALEGVGLTAAVATALAELGIPCNMVAGYFHDHAFVPEAQADAALACLKALADRV